MKLLSALSVIALTVSCATKNPAPKNTSAKSWDGKAKYSATMAKQQACQSVTKHRPASKVNRSIASTPTCSDYSSIIYGGQTYNTGTVQVENDPSHLNIHLASNVGSGWYIQAVHIYAGTGPIPTNSQGVPAPGQFPVKESFEVPQTGLTYALPLDELQVDCGSDLNIAVHTEMVKLNEAGEVVQSETGWGHGPFAFDANRWGWYFNYKICCDDVKPHGCTLTQGYWKNHHSKAKNASQRVAWPVSESTTLCGKTWLNVLHTAPKTGDAWTILAHQWIAAQLNVANGASVPEGVSTALSTSQSLLTANCSGIPPAQRQAALESSLILDSYNNGLIGPGHCE
jgi:hypothetical protein